MRRTIDIREKILQNLLVINNYGGWTASFKKNNMFNDLERAMYIGRFARTFSY